MWIMLKNDMFGCFIIEEIRDKDNETGLKEGGVIEMSTTVLPYTRCSLLRFSILTTATSKSPTIILVLLFGFKF